MGRHGFTVAQRPIILTPEQRQPACLRVEGGGAFDIGVRCVQGAQFNCLAGAVAQQHSEGGIEIQPARVRSDSGGGVATLRIRVAERVARPRRLRAQSSRQVVVDLRRHGRHLLTKIDERSLHLQVGLGRSGPIDPLQQHGEEHDQPGDGGGVRRFERVAEEGAQRQRRLWLRQHRVIGQRLTRAGVVLHGQKRGERWRQWIVEHGAHPGVGGGDADGATAVQQSLRLQQCTVALIGLHKQRQRLLASVGE